jgi:hypothetical protein
MRIFTKTFFELSPVDQNLVVEANLRECDEVIGRGVDSVSRSRARARRKRIEQKAIEFGIWDDGEGEQSNAEAQETGRA